MSVHCLSLNHHQIPIDLRERLALSATERADCLRHLRHGVRVAGAMLLSTCNRLELYSSGSPEGSRWLRSWLVERLPDLDTDAGELGVSYQEQECLRHLLKVACGLDSQSVGETQIFGQIKSAYQQSIELDVLDSQLHHLLQYAFSKARSIRRNLDLNRHPVSIAGTAVQLMTRLYPDIHDKRILIVGAGATGRIVAEYLHKLNFHELCILNRSPESARALAGRFGARHGGLDQIADSLAWADIIFSCIDNRPGIIGKGMAESAVAKRRHRPQLAFDLGVPRNLEPEIAALDDVFLYNLDSIHQMTRKHGALRRQKANEAQRLIDISVDDYQRLSQVRSSGELIDRFRRGFIEDSNALLEEAMRRAGKGDTRQAMSWLLARVQAKGLHLPTQLLKGIARHDKELLREIVESTPPRPDESQASE